MNILDLLMGAGTGGLLGGVLALGNTWLSARVKKDERAHELEVMKVQGAIRVTGEEWAAFRASQDSAASDNSSAVWPWAASIRTLTRPFLTVGLLAASAGVYWTAPVEARPELGRDILMLTGTAIGWWFGSRPTLLSSKR